MSKSSRFRWFKSQWQWHDLRAKYYASPLIQVPAYRDAERWHISQAKWYQRRMMGL